MVEPMMEPLLRRCTSASRTVLLSNCIMSPKYSIFFSFSLSYSILTREVGVLVLEKVNPGVGARKTTIIRL